MSGLELLLSVLLALAVVAIGVALARYGWLRRHQLVDLAPVAQDALFANLGDGVVVVNLGGQVVAVNPAALVLMCATTQAVVGAGLAALPSPWGNACAALLTDGLEQELWVNGRSVALRRSSLTTSPHRVVGHILTFHDVTAYRVLQDQLVGLNDELELRVAARTAELEQTVVQLQAEVQARQEVETTLRHLQESLADHVAGLSRHLSALYEVILLGGKALDLATVRQLTLKTIVTALHADAGFLFNSTAGAQRLELAVQQGFSAEQVEQLLQADPAWLLGDPIPRTILDLPDATELPAAIRLSGMQACLLAMIDHMGAAVGAVGVYWRRAPVLSVEEIALFRALSDQLAVLAENVRLRQAHDRALVQEERQRIARELHDSVTQSLYALMLNADAAAVRLQNGRTAGLEILLQRIATASGQALREIRLLLYELRLATPDAMSLADALQLRLDAVEKRVGIDAVLVIDHGLTLSPQVAQALYWIAIEALNNSLKHAGAHRVDVRVHCRTGAVELCVADDGRGLAPDLEHGAGYGLRNMAERAAQIGGVLTLSTLPAGGAQIHVHVPALDPDGSQTAEEVVHA